MQETLPKMPAWLKELAAKNKRAYHQILAEHMQKRLDTKGLHTVCEEARCPNRGECFSHADATVMILGNICTRSCRFCAVPKFQKPCAPQESEALQTAALVKETGIKYLVLTMPTRDDLPDGGAQHINRVISEVKRQNPACLVEALISDLGGRFEHIKTILDSGPAVLGHNVETVPSLYKAVRCGADYGRSLDLLKEVKRVNKNILTKSSIMLGLGETKEELLAVFEDLRSVGCNLLTLGQYLAPSAQHYPVKSYPEPAFYDHLAQAARKMGFGGVMAGPLVRSSYRAGQLYNQYREQDKAAREK